MRLTCRGWGQSGPLVPRPVAWGPQNCVLGPDAVVISPWLFPAGLGSHPHLWFRSQVVVSSESSECQQSLRFRAFLSQSSAKKQSVSPPVIGGTGAGRGREVPVGTTQPRPPDLRAQRPPLRDGMCLILAKITRQVRGCSFLPALLFACCVASDHPVNLSELSFSHL